MIVDRIFVVFSFPFFNKTNDATQLVVAVDLIT